MFSTFWLAEGIAAGSVIRYTHAACVIGATENAGVANAIRSKLQGWKMQEWKKQE